jgi:hypothetical protein
MPEVFSLTSWCRGDAVAALVYEYIRDLATDHDHLAIDYVKSE